MSGECGCHSEDLQALGTVLEGSGLIVVFLAAPLDRLSFFQNVLPPNAGGGARAT
jgi:hypothetical protein